MASAEQPEGDLGVDPIDHPAEVHAEEPGDERERDEDRRHDAHQIGALVELEIEQHPHPVRGGVDRREQAVDLLVQPVERRARRRRRSRGSAPISTPSRSKTACSAVTQRRIVASLAPAACSVALGTLAARRSRSRQGVQLQLDLLERVEGAREHRVEDGVDDVSPAPFLRKVGGQRRRQREPLLMKRQQVLAGDHDPDLDRSASGTRPRRPGGRLAT